MFVLFFFSVILQRSSNQPIKDFYIETKINGKARGVFIETTRNLNTDLSSSSSESEWLQTKYEDVNFPNTHENLKSNGNRKRKCNNNIWRGGLMNYEVKTTQWSLNDMDISDTNNATIFFR